MKGESIDPRREKLIGLLYGELSEEEERELRAVLETNAELAAELAELREAREFLKDWEVEEKTPGFVMVESGGRGRAAGEPRGGFAAGLRRFATNPAWWGMAAAAVLLLVLAANDFRVERMNGGLILRLGQAQETPSTFENVAESPGRESLAKGSPRPPAGDLASRLNNGLLPVEGQSPYLTRAQFESYSEQMTRMIVALIKEYGSSRDREMGEAIQTMYHGLSDQQFHDYQELRKRIDAMGTGMVTNQVRGRDDGSFPGSGRGVPLEPLGSTTDGTEDEGR